VTELLRTTGIHFQARVDGLSFLPDFHMLAEQLRDECARFIALGRRRKPTRLALDRIEGGFGSC